MVKGHLITGKCGEEIAAEHLQKRGYTLLGKNVQTGRGEVDLVLQRKGIIVFVEVKTRTRRDEFSPSQRVDHEKIQRLSRAAQAWLQRKYERGAPEMQAQIDVIGIAGSEIVEHFEDVTA